MTSKSRSSFYSPCRVIQVPILMCSRDFLSNFSMWCVLYSSGFCLLVPRAAGARKSATFLQCLRTNIHMNVCFWGAVGSLITGTAVGAGNAGPTCRDNQVGLVPFRELRFSPPMAPSPLSDRSTRSPSLFLLMMSGIYADGTAGCSSPSSR